MNSKESDDAETRGPPDDGGRDASDADLARRAAKDEGRWGKKAAGPCPFCQAEEGEAHKGACPRWEPATEIGEGFRRSQTLYGVDSTETEAVDATDD